VSVSAVTQDDDLHRRPAHVAARRPSPWDRLRHADPVLYVAIAGALALRVFAIGTQSLWWDELATVGVVDRPVSDVLGAVRTSEGTPPLYYAAAWAWAGVFGMGDVALRSLSALMGVATVPVVYGAAGALGLTRRPARMAAVLVAVNPMLIWYSQEARAYALLALLGALSVLFLARYLTGSRRADLLAWGVVGAAALLTHYFAVFVIAAEALCLLVADPRHWRRLVAACTPIVVAVLALVPLALSQRSTNHQEWIDDTALGTRVAAAGRHFVTGPASPDNRFWWVGAAALVVAGVLAARSGRVERSAFVLMAGLGALVVVLPLLAGIASADYFLDRNVIVAVIPFIVATAAGLGAARGGWGGWVGVAAVTVMSVVTVVSVARDPIAQKSDWRAVAAALDDGGDGAVVIVDTNGFLGLPLLRYSGGARAVGRDERVTTSEVDVLLYRRPSPSSGAECTWWVGHACALESLGRRLPDDLTDRFTLSAERRAGQFTVAIYTAGEAVTVRASDLVTGELVPGELGGPLVLLTGPVP
jgi:hypothetical protein